MIRSARILLTALAMSAGVASAAPGYVLKENQPRAGTSIVRAYARGPLPFDKAWAELNAEQQAQVRAGYADLPAGDEPPFPAEGLGPMTRVMVEGLWRLQLDGPVRLRVQVDAEGRASDAEVIACPGGEVAARFAGGVATLTRFKPARCAGLPCAKPFVLELTAETWR
ncbi:MAG: hypothetical protein HY021_08800 [Burkholderiales bacterium]|nr:hypothetical protein [Burkholderiales bacterium]